jgi:hypothetical protein
MVLLGDEIYLIFRLLGQAADDMKVLRREILMDKDNHHI